MIWVRRIFMGIAIIILLLVLAAVGLFFATAGDYTVLATASDDPSITTIELNGGVFHYETFGSPDNPVVIVVHGGPGSDYRSMLDLQALADEYFVVFYDRRGTGLSPRVDDPSILTYENTIDDLNAFVEYFSKGQPVSLIGHSFGGNIATTYTARHPENVEALALLEPGPLTQEMAEQGPVFGFSFSTMGTLVTALFESLHIKDAPDSDAAFDYVTGRMMIASNPGYWCGGKADDSVEGWRFSYDAFFQIAASVVDENGKQMNKIGGIENYETPVLFLASACNTVIGEEFQTKQMQYFQDAKLLVIPDSGHDMIAENPEASLNAIRSYLNEVVNS